MSIPTPHIGLNDQSKIAKRVLMPGDPLRAKYIAETFLEDVEQINSIRGMLGFTGTYKGEKITVMGSGMGMPSIGIYSYELFAFYGVEEIIRIGSAGAYSPDLDLYDVVVVKEAYSESSYAYVQSGKKETNKVLKSNEDLTNRLIATANRLNIPVHVERIHSSDVFYNSVSNTCQIMYEEHGCACVEMESFALFHNANQLGKKAACLLTISDSLVTKKVTSAEERQTAFEQMMKIALELK